MRNIMLTTGMTTAILLAGCATPTVVEVSRPQDSRLSCQELENEIAEAERFRRDAEKEKGVTGTNVAAALFFWPAMLGTYKNVGDAVDAANDRKRHLTDIYNDKGCAKS